MISFRCNSEHECSILADSDIFGGDPCLGVPKYLEVYFGCFQGMFMFSLFFSFSFKGPIYFSWVACIIIVFGASFVQIMWIMIIFFNGGIVSQQRLSCNFLTSAFLKLMQSLLSGSLAAAQSCNWISVNPKWQNSRCNCNQQRRLYESLWRMTWYNWKAVFG